jgi:CheY-like chemotaxis protein
MRAGEGNQMNKSGRTPLILIVEDTDWIRFAMRNVLEREGYCVAEAMNDAEAFEVAELQPIDLILTEEELPTFNDLMARLREHPTLSDVPVVIIDPDAAEGARLGDAYLLVSYSDIASFLSVVYR